MKKVIIVRHAKSSWTDFSLSDFDRPLDNRGHHDAPIMAARLKEEGHIPQRIITSNATRAKTTARYFSQVFDVPVEEARDLYHGLAEDYLDIIKTLDENVECVALFGHNPGITFLANLIKMGSTDNIPTCGIVIAEVKGPIWAKTEWEDLRLIGIMTPKDAHHD